MSETAELVPDEVLKAHGLRSLGERVSPAKLREMADALRAAADEAEGAAR